MHPEDNDITNNKCSIDNIAAAHGNNSLFSLSKLHSASTVDEDTGVDENGIISPSSMADNNNSNSMQPIDTKADA